MGVKTENVKAEAEKIEDDVSDKTVEDDLSEDTMSALKAKLAKKNKTEENVKAALEKVEGEKMPVVIVEKRKRSLNFGIVSTGQAGGRIGSVFAEHGYPCIAINTASVDLETINIPEDNKLLLNWTLGGAAKSLDTGAEAAEANRDAIAELVSNKLSDVHAYLVTVSLGGGSGAGSLNTVIDVLSQTGKPIAVICVLPLSVDDPQTKQNAIETLSKLTKLAQNKIVANIICVDNAVVETVFSDVSEADFFNVSNKAIVEPLHVFNTLSSKPGLSKALDSQEWATLFLDSGGFSVYGELNVHDISSDTALAEAVIESLDNNLLAKFDLSQTKYAAAVFVAHPDTWKQLPSTSVNYAVAILNEKCEKSIAVFRGLYEDSSIDVGKIKVFTIYSGLGLPTERINILRQEVEIEMAKVKNRDKSHNVNLELDTGKNEVINAADKVRDLIKKKSNNFNKNFTGIKDFRKK